MKRRFFSQIFSPIFFVILLVSCSKKDTTPEPPVPEPPIETEAVFTIVPSTTGCPDIVIDRTYFTGEAINNADSIPVKINVSKAGTWSYQSDTINGISFSGAGTIDSTGEQFISVAAKGTPVLPGNTAYIFQTDTSQVNVYVSVLDKTFTPEPVPGDAPYFKVTIDHIEYNITHNTSDPSMQTGTWGYANDTLAVGAGIGPSIWPNPPGTGSITIQQNYYDTLHSGMTDEEFKKIFQPGNYPYAIRACNAMTKGFIVFWNDSDDNGWRTYSDEQTGSYFKIVGQTDGYNSEGQYYVKVKMRFQCKLYSFATGEMKELTDGEMVAHFVRYE